MNGYLKIYDWHQIGEMKNELCGGGRKTRF